MFFSRYFFLVISQIIIPLGCSAANLQEFSLETPAQILILLGYSKGATDILHFLVDYINLDHWAIAVPVREKMASAGWAAASNHPHVRGLLFEAMILFLVEKLAF